MASYIPDTNILIGYGRDVSVRQRLEQAVAKGTAFIIAPAVIIELVRGIIANGGKTFTSDQEVFRWIQANGFPLLELTLPFAARILKSRPTRTSGVLPGHYVRLIAMVSGSANFDEFIAQTEAPNSVWRLLGNLHVIHERQLDKEIGALVPLAAAGQDPATSFSKMFGMPGCRPNPLVVRKVFSAAFEFLESWLVKVKSGAKPRKNDPGMYVDFQLFFYLADLEHAFLTQEDFSAEIRKSPQKNRIVRIDSV